MSCPIQVTNNAVTRIPAAVLAEDTEITVAEGEGLLFPMLDPGQHFYATITDVYDNYEIVKVTWRADDRMLITRAQEGTFARDFVANSRFELRVTAATVAELAACGGEGEGGEGECTLDVQAIAAAGSDAASATLLGDGFNYVTNAGGGRGVRLPEAVAGRFVIIVSSEAEESLLVYPATGESINNLAADTPLNTAAEVLPTNVGTPVWLIAYDDNNWYTPIYTPYVEPPAADADITVLNIANEGEGSDQFTLYFGAGPNGLSGSTLNSPTLAEIYSTWDFSSPLIPEEDNYPDMAFVGGAGDVQNYEITIALRGGATTDAWAVSVTSSTGGISLGSFTPPGSPVAEITFTMQADPNVVDPLTYMFGVAEVTATVGGTDYVATVELAIQAQSF